jgi:Tfp pilus assembly protein PilV
MTNKPAVGLVATSNLTNSGAQTVDGVLGIAGTTLVLETAQTTTSQNGPWLMQSGAYTRPCWYPSGGTTQAFQFAVIRVRLGTTYAGSLWDITSAGAVTIDTTATTWGMKPMAAGGLQALVPSNATYTASGCSNGTKVGGAIAGPGIFSAHLTAGASGTCTLVVTGLPTVLNDWVCGGSNITSQIPFVQTALSATGCTVAGAASTNDIVTIWGIGH